MVQGLHPTLRFPSPVTPADLARLRAFVTERGSAAVGRLERHLARPRYRPAFTRIADRDRYIAGYALIGHQRLQLGAGAFEAGRIAADGVTTAAQDPNHVPGL